MNEGNNTKIIDACIDEFRKSNEISAEVKNLFELFSGIQITKRYNLSADEIQTASVDGAKDGGVDIFLTILDENIISTAEDLDELEPIKSSTLELIILQSKSEPTFKESAIDKLIASMPIILDLNVDEDKLLDRFNPILSEKIAAFRRAWLAVAKKGGKISCKYYYATRANIFSPSPAFESKVQQLINLTKDKLATDAVSFNAYSAKELFDLFKLAPPETRDLPFAANPMSMKYNDGIGYIGLVRLNEFSEFIKSESGNLDERIFESNVRHYQGNVDVNNRIKETLREDKGRDFWWMNNGITIVATSATAIGDTLTLGSPQIVNGLQTSFSIGESYEESDKDGRSILVKVIVSDDQETVDKVISATNRQTSVQDASLRATDEVQRQIETFFESKGYYYDRRKNYHRNKGKPLSKIFSIQYTAQAIHAILNRSPMEARTKPTSLIKDEETYASIFDADKSYEAYLTCCLIVKNARLVLVNLKEDQQKILGSFVFYLARIATSFACGRAVYSANDVAKLVNKDLTRDYTNAADWLMNKIVSFNSDNPSMNVINIAKSRQFGDYINSKLIEEFK